MCPASSIFHNLHTTFSICRTQSLGFYHKLTSVSLSTIEEFLEKECGKLREVLLCVDYLWFIYLPCYWLFCVPVLALTETLFGIGNTDYINPGAADVPTFYAPRVDGSSIAFLIYLPTIAVAFGGLHCIGWNFHFPTPVEQLLWRIGSLAITFIPLVPVVLMLFFAFAVSLHVFLQDRYNFKFPDFIHRSSIMNILESLCITLWTILGVIGLMLCVIGYLLARLLLLTQAIMLLRRQPNSAFYAINWVDFLPHM